MRKKIYYFLIIFSLLHYGCTRQQKQQVNFETNSPKVVEARGYVVPQDSMAPPKVVPVKGVKRIAVGKPKVVNLNSNVYSTGTPKVIQAGTPRICTPGQDTFKLPKIVSSIDSPFTAGLPEVVVAKDPQNKDNNPASFSSFTTLHGLKSNNIGPMIQDKAGNLWLGSWGGGVSKYDGRSFTHYNTSQGMSNDIVWSILEDRNGNLWFGTIGGGVNKFDGKSFTHFTTDQGLINNNVGRILEDKNGNFWFGTWGGGVSRYDGKSFTHYTTAQGLSNYEVNSILEDKNGNLWFGTNGSGVIKFDGKSFTHYTTDQGLSNNGVSSILEDKNGNFWVGTYGGGVNKYDGKSFTNYSTAQGLSSEIVMSILEDKSGNLWFGTWDKGVNRFDGESFTHFSIAQGLSSQGVNSILEDKSGILWFSTGRGGVSKYDGGIFTHVTTAQGLNNENINSILEDKSGNLWVGTFGGGVNKYDGKSLPAGQASITHYTIAQGLSNDDVMSMLEDSHGNLWFGIWGSGIDKYDGTSFTHYSTAQGLSSDGLACIFEDKKGNLWFGTVGGGVNKFDGNSFTQYSTAQGLRSNIVLSILEDKYNNLWFGTMGGGVNKFDGKSFTHYSIPQGLNDATVNSILEDKSGNLWFGTSNGGVNKFDGKTFTQYTTAQGLSNNGVNSILEDKDGNIWFLTSNGLSKMRLPQEESAEKRPGISKNPGTHLFKNYLLSDGFLGVGSDYNTLIPDKDGNIWAGANDRITCYHPERDIPDTIPPHIQLSGISLFNENINWLSVEKKKDTTLILSNGVAIQDFKFSGLSKWYYIPEQLELAYNNNYLTFQFVGVTTKRPNNVKYQYILEGLDESWSSITDRPEASYSDLPNGKYTFKVKTVNSEGYWSNEFVYGFTILPPWWKTWWAYGLYALAFVVSVSAFIQYRSQKLKAENIHLEEKVTHRTTQLKKSLVELKETQEQLIQREKMASLGELTAGIAHEIQNPLNFVNNFSEVNAELLQEMKEEIKRGNYNEVNTIADGLIDNEEKISHHGKRADAIVKGMLQHSRISSGQKELTDINALADEYLRLSYHGLRAKDKSFNVTIKTHFDESVGKINIIPQDIGRVLLNLYNNAFYAVSEKKKLPPSPALGGAKEKTQLDYEPLVTVTTRRLSSPPTGGAEGLEIRVKDNGNGIPENVKHKIFQPFFTTKPTGQGTGLGLSLSYDIITKEHDGTIKVETKEGEGAEFVVELSVK